MHKHQLLYLSVLVANAKCLQTAIDCIQIPSILCMQAKLNLQLYTARLIGYDNWDKLYFSTICGNDTDIA